MERLIRDKTKYSLGLQLCGPLRLFVWMIIIRSTWSPRSTQFGHSPVYTTYYCRDIMSLSYFHRYSLCLDKSRGYNHFLFFCWMQLWRLFNVVQYSLNQHVYSVTETVNSSVTCVKTQSNKKPRRSQLTCSFHSSLFTPLIHLYHFLFIQYFVSLNCKQLLKLWCFLPVKTTLKKD